MSLGAIFIWFGWGPHTSMLFSIPFNFLIFCFTPIHICGFTLLFWHFLTLWFVQWNPLTAPFTCFCLVAFLLIVHSTFLFWYLLANLNLIRSTFFRWNLPTILDLFGKKNQIKSNRSHRMLTVNLNLGPPKSKRIL